MIDPTEYGKEYLDILIRYNTGLFVLVDVFFLYKCLGEI